MAAASGVTAAGQPHSPQRPFSSTSVTVPMAVRRPASFRRGEPAAAVAGVIATRTSSRHDTSPHVVQRKCG